MHVAGAFKMITKLLTVFNLTNVPLFAACTLGTFLAFAVLYALVYRATAKVYYRIVTPGDQGWRE
jgi:putative ABC transport system permease protein